MAPNFREVQKFKAEFCPTEFGLYESNTTGMRVITVDQKGPKVYGYFTLATEIHDDSGSPHTLEHLVFMGSKSYQYKGLLDKLATRAYSNTNAWTATDHTAYTVGQLCANLISSASSQSRQLETAGWDGFAQILPVYLEHVLLPTLTDAGCYTEVHHVDGSGNDAGVVYSEMQGTQNQQSDLMDLQARRLLYPKHIGFRSETGGLMEQLRVLTADRIRSFHREMYQPKNLCLILIGEIDHKNLFQILDKFEAGIKHDVPRLDEPFVRPWSKAGKSPALTKSILDTVEFPEEDESTGEILIGFLGPDVNDDLLTDALSVLLMYICGSSVSLLENTLVEKESVASGVYYYSDARPDVTIWFTVSGVETDQLKAVEKRFFEVLSNAADEPLDLEYMRDCLHRCKRQLKFHSESSGNFFAESIISDHLFGKRDGSTLNTIGTLKEFDVLEKWSESEWKDFFRHWLVDAHHVAILGVPSKKLSKKLKEDEEARVAAQREKLGKEGLERLAKKLEEAKAENDIEIPKEVLQQFAIPGTESIHFIPTTTARSGLARKMGDLDNSIQQRIDTDKTDLPLFIHFEHIPTNFVHLNLFLCTHTIPVELRPLLPVFLVNFFDTPVKRNGVRLEFEDVVTALEQDTIGYGISSASGFGNNEILRIRMEVEPQKYDSAISWIRDFLFNTIFDATRLKATLAKILADIPEEKRSGSSMAACVVNLLHYSRESSVRAQNVLVKAICLRRTLALLQKSPEAVISKLETILSHLTEPSNFRVLVFANLDSTSALPTPVSSWKALTASLDMTNPTLNPLDPVKATLSPAGRNPGNLTYIVPMQTIDSSFATATALGPSSYTDPTLPALFVALAYLDAVEGPLWVAVRGTGLAYGVGFTKSVDVGRLQFRIYRSPDAHKAFRVAKDTVAALADGRTPPDEAALEGAVSSIVVGFADEQPTMGSAAAVSFANQVVKGIPKDWGQGFLKDVRAVRWEDVAKSLREVVLPVFLPGSADVVVTCATIMQEGMVKGFEEEGFKPEVQPLSFFQDDYGMEGAELVDGEASDEEEGDEDDDEEEESDGGEDETV